ncbi:hypothetical protein M569_01595 [Genlisea aurea]|uniref:Protein POLYCHOME n=1 Tax=Genlisea aurea TaxID=192259 RepID=S8EKM2_9LAMI|nr:hypothetical protein M569_01595 [Genlisea aurea]
MPEARDRLPRQDHPVAAAYSRSQYGSRPVDGRIGRGTVVAFVLEDENEGMQSNTTPFRWRGTAMVGSPRPIGNASGTGNFRTPRVGRYAALTGHENLSPLVGSGRGRASRPSPLPSWYPRRPLNDITAVLRAIERRRERERIGESLTTESPLLRDQTPHNPSTSSALSDQPNQYPTIVFRHSPLAFGKVPKILLDITYENSGETACLTPQKKLLNNIESIEKVVLEELRNLKRTPSAKKAAREKRVRTLMSMR